jgi:SAM-dependent methyltransferase
MTDREGFRNVYDDATRSASYASLEFPGTYFLGFRDIPELLREHVRGGRRAVDFGCGAGRSTRFLRGLGFAAVGLDIAEPMLAEARQRDPGGDYRLVHEPAGAGGPAGARPVDVGGLPPGEADLVFSAFTFDNIPTREKKLALFRALRGLLAPGGRLVNLVSSSEIYVHEWASFSTRDFPENRQARCGDRVRIVMLDVSDRRPVEDVVWTDEGYRELYAGAGLREVAVHRPLGRADEPYAWASETSVAPWTIWVLEAVPAHEAGPGPRAGTVAARARGRSVGR